MFINNHDKEKEDVILIGSYFRLHLLIPEVKVALEILLYYSSII